MKKISIVIPNHNMERSIGICLEAALASDYPDFEVIVVDDCSTDNSLEIIKGYPCTLISLKDNKGASAARNTGAQKSSGDIIFFTDSDCLLQKDTISLAGSALSKEGDDAVIGGTYTAIPPDTDFFSIFQSVSINFSETKNTADPDYIATHAMTISARTFRESGGFPETFLPIIEDVEFSHRLRRSGKRLVMYPEIQVQHTFNFSLLRSLKNAFKKSRYWTMYSLENKDLASDSGCASSELKLNVILNCISILLLASWMIFQNALFIYPIPLLFGVNIFSSRGMLGAFFRARGVAFGISALLYWTILYPIPVGLGGVAGLTGHIFKK
jgi:glycosyltransferase involved in cell wall biosynthesis